MQCPTITEVPAPLIGKTGWPWTEESKPIPPQMPDGKPWPKISIVTPSYNQGQYLEETIRSVLLQNYPNLEYIIMDGGSTDNSVEIIKKYNQWITCWMSEEDKGQAHALNKGFRKSTGLLVGWQNSDDYYGPGAFEHCAVMSKQRPEADVYHGTSHCIDENGIICLTVFTEQFIPSEIPDAFPQFKFSNQSIFINRRIFDSGQFMDEKYKHAMDTEFMVRLIIAGGKFQYVPGLIGFYRIHKDAKTFYQSEIAASESVNICINLLESLNTPSDIKNLALRGLRTNLISLFRKFKLKEFRIALYKMIKFGGIKVLDTKLAMRFLFSLLGKQAVNIFLFTYKYFRRIVRCQNIEDNALTASKLCFYEKLLIAVKSIIS